MEAKQLLLTQITQAIAPPAPPPIFVAEVAYPPDSWYRLANETEQSPEDLAQYIVDNLPTEEVIATVTRLDQAREEVTVNCGLRLAVLFRRDEAGGLHLDDIRFMDATEFSAFRFNSGKKKPV